MSTLLDTLRTVIEGVIVTFGALGLFLLMLIESLFPPIPSELVLPFAGSLVAQHQLKLVTVLVATTLGALVGAALLYYLGYRLGEARTRALFRRYGRWLLLSEDDLDQALRLFRRFDRGTVFACRLLPGLRSLISIPAGIAGMPLAEFLLFTTLGTVLWNGLLAGAGMLLGHNWALVLAIVDRFEMVFWLLLGVVVVALLTRRVAKLRRSPRRSSPDVEPSKRGSGH